ncbi:hypothetical protein DV711_06550 [Motiliproteus coralliicola]|uniref:Uncharacterized protein n=1 Tax=Motiliproteus coralliicola TaxID=2283196 RepID=A0A369WVZ4_9GAMM|nr:DUF6498-containing protein [Motiliproteus coralliicola]RDE25209.1 hypothetical protein DV711_06550 [Motiliproteus coralliicola]
MRAAPAGTLVQRTRLDLVAFLVGLGIAYAMQWQTRDLVWSLWLCSLVLGYLTLLSAILAGAVAVIRGASQPGVNRGVLLPLLLAIGGGGLFFLAFFSFHFGAFHAGHSVFLNSFFPIEGMPDDGFGDAFMNPLLLWTLTFEHLMVPYGIFLLPAVLAERRHLLKPIIDAVRPEQDVADRELPETVQKPAEKRKSQMGDAMSRPYMNVVRMHLLIFFFAFCHFLALESFIVYAVVYSVYFFPWSEIKRRRNDNHALSETS